MLLQRAYVDARYDPNYKITANELKWLAARIKILRDITATLRGSRYVPFSVAELLRRMKARAAAPAKNISENCRGNNLAQMESGKVPLKRV